MRQVNMDELIHLLEGGLRGLGPSVRKGLVNTRSRQRREAQLMAARQMAERFRRLEILSDAPEPPPFRWADFEGGSGVPAVDAE